MIYLLYSPGLKIQILQGDVTFAHLSYRMSFDVFFFSTRSVIPSSARDRHFPSTAQSTAQDVLHNLFRSWHGLRLWIIIFRLIFSPGIIMFLAVASFLLPLPDSYRALQKLQKNLRH